MVRPESLYTILTKGGIFWRSNQIREKGFGAPKDNKVWGGMYMEKLVGNEGGFVCADSFPCFLSSPWP